MTVDRAGTFNLSGALVVYCNVGVVLCGTLGVSVAQGWMLLGRGVVGRAEILNIFGRFSQRNYF